MATPFTVIVPKKITDANFVSSTIPETDHAVWSSVTAYTIGQRVIMTTGLHKIYEALTNNTNKQPNLNTSGLTPDWVEVGPTNRWAAFDESGGTLSTATTSMQFVFTADYITSMAFAETLAETVQIVGSVGGTPFYNQTFSLPDRAIINDWYDYFTADIFRATQLVVENIPSVAAATFTITLTSGTGSAVQLGNFVCGKSTALGATQYGASFGIIDYSKKEVNDFGKATLIPGPYSKRMDVRLYVSSQSVDAVAVKLNSIRATPCFWVGSGNNYEALGVYGYYRDYSMDIAYPTYSVCSLQIEGLV